MRATSVTSTTTDLAIWRFLLALLEAMRWRRDALLRIILPLPVILKRLATDLRVLLRAIDFGIGKGREDIESEGLCKQILQEFFKSRGRQRLCCHFIWPIDGTETEAGVVFSAIVFAAALNAGGFLTQGLNAGQHGVALGAGVEKLACDFAAFEGEFVTTGLIRDAKIRASLAPLDPMGFDAAATGAVLGKKVREFVTQGSLHLGGRNLDELGIQQNHAFAEHRHACGGTQSGIPINARVKIPATDRLEKLIGKILQQGILTQSGISARLFDVVRLGANSTHHGATEIKEQLTVFHAARAG